MRELYLDDSYLKEFESVVKEVNRDKFIVLENTAFYPNGGGQPFDTGKMIAEYGTSYQVVFVGKFSGQISHEVDKPGLKVGDKIKGVVDWDRRYKLMRMHTAAHILSGIIENETSALISGNQLSLDKTRLDFNLDDYDPQKIPDWIKKSNEVVDKDLPVKVSFMPREEAMKDQSLFKLVAGFPHKVHEIRIVDIVGLVKEADGGTHVKSTKEVGHLKFLKAENKGKKNRRVYITLS